jgi:hypothetical protein
MTEAMGHTPIETILKTLVTFWGLLSFIPILWQIRRETRDEYFCRPRGSRRRKRA